MQTWISAFSMASSGIIPCIHPANEERCYIVTSSLIGWVHTRNDPWKLGWGLWVTEVQFVNTLRPRQDGRHFPDNIFKCFFLNENVWILIKTSLKFIPTGAINNIPALVQIMAWRQSGDKPSSEPMMVSLLMHICVTQPQWVNITGIFIICRNS